MNSLQTPPPDLRKPSAEPAGAVVGPLPGRSRPRLGFLGVGWIGRNRMEAIYRSGIAEVVAIADSSTQLAREAQRQAPGAAVLSSLSDLFAVPLDGIVIATPSALHAEQAIAALSRGLAVFCQKPLGRSEEETRRVIAAARANHRLLGVDLSYRCLSGIRHIRELCQGGELGSVYAVDLVFHNAYGPDKDWFYDRSLSGGGCVIDLGIHLVDLALWCLGFPQVRGVTSRLLAQGKPLEFQGNLVEDYAVARLDLGGDLVVRLACSWRLPAGCDAIISGSFYGTRGGAAFRNQAGSFYDFITERFAGTKRSTLAEGPEAWGGRAVLDWAEHLKRGSGFDSSVEDLGRVAQVLDAIYTSALERREVSLVAGPQDTSPQFNALLSRAC